MSAVQVSTGIVPLCSKICTEAPLIPLQGIDRRAVLLSSAVLGLLWQGTAWAAGDKVFCGSASRPDPFKHGALRLVTASMNHGHVLTDTDMQVFVAGAAGKTGRRVVDYLVSQGLQVRAGVRVRTIASLCTLLGHPATCGQALNATTLSSDTHE